MTYAATEDQEARVVQGVWEEGRLVTEETSDGAGDGAEGTDTPEPPAEATGNGEAASE